MKCMHIQVKHIKSTQLQTTNWSGGTTTQIAISPENSSYAERTFNWRISTATVEVDQSNFSALPGVKRFITSLKGDLKLIHQGHHTSDLKPYEVDSFLGDWNTTSYGQVTDFNLMVQDGFIGIMRGISLGSNAPCQVSFSPDIQTAAQKNIGFYAYESKLYIKVDGIPYNLEAGDFLLIESSDASPTDQPSIQLTAEADCMVCTVEVAKL